MKKTFITIAFVLLISPTTAFAVEITNSIFVEANTGGIVANAKSNNDSVSQLLAQIEALRKQIAKIQLELDSVNGGNTLIVRETVKSIDDVDTKVFIRKLSVGNKGDDVTKLQKFLSLDKEIYPEGLVTGYYGVLTKKAVSKYQEKNGLESVGILGPKTRALMNNSYNNSKTKVVAVDVSSLKQVENKYGGVFLKSDAEKGKVYWSVEQSKKESSLIALWSKEPLPTYPARAKDIWVYFEDYAGGELELEAKDGIGKYYVRICAFEAMANTCKFYSNQVEIELK